MTNPGWKSNDQKFLLSSDCNNRTNLYSLDLTSGEITQLTDLDPAPLPREVEFLRACVSADNNEAYFWHDLSLIALDLDTLEQRVLYVMEEGWDVSMCNVTPDGKYICVGFKETWAAKPKSPDLLSRRTLEFG